LSSIPNKNDLIGIFARHPVAANLLMVMMILAGALGLAKLNTQFFPTFAVDFVNITVKWTGATAEDVETAVTAPLEQELRALDGLKKMTSTSGEGRSSITLEYKEGTDMGSATDQVKERVALVRNLPGAAEEPEVKRIIRYEPIARLLVTGPDTIDELRPIIRNMESELLERGIANIAITGMPDEEIAVQVPSAKLRELDLSLDDIARRIARGSRDMPAGTIGRDESTRQLRALEQRRDTAGFANLPLITDDSGRFLTLGEVAIIERRARAKQVETRRDGRPAVEMLLRRAENSDSLDSANVLETWLAERLPELPAGIKVEVYDEAWRLIKERIMLLITNGGGGLVLVVLVLFAFLNGRVAFWVAVGIPVSFMATLGVLWVLGGSINMISLFGLIMALGIIVDDAIVVGEDALTHYQRGENALQAAEGGARRMLAPVMSSSLTTVAAFLPLMLVGGIIGTILFAIPLVVVCVIFASLIESFLVLPGHLRATLVHVSQEKTGKIRTALDNGFTYLRDRLFRPLVTGAVARPFTTISCAVTALVLAISLIVGNRIAFNFFPTAEATILHANIAFVSGTSPSVTKEYALHVAEALAKAEKELGIGLVKTALVQTGQLQASQTRSRPRGDQFANIMVELAQPDDRDVRNRQIIDLWRKNVREQPGIESLSIFERRGGPPGRDLDISLQGAAPAKLKLAALELAQSLKTVPGVSGIEDDLPYGAQQLIYSLTPQGRALGLTVEDVGRQLRNSYDGSLAQIFQDQGDEVEVRVMLPDAERYRLGSLESIGIRLASGSTVPLLTAVDIAYRRGFETLRHLDGNLSVRVVADVDPALNNNDAVISALRESVLTRLVDTYGITYQFEGRAADQAETLGDMKLGLVFGLAMIYLVLAWVFASYGWPLVVMMAIPFGLVGAITGHFLMGIDLTILSLFGFFGLSGIVVNDSIILVIFFKQLREGGMPYKEAIIEAACQRLRAVLLTSLTTIGGLTPLLFETSLQAQFLIPMAVSISFGLALATALVLIVIPAMLNVHEMIAERFGSHAGEEIGPDLSRAALGGADAN
jgi:multidrug efflux pump subunit AcrB